MSIYSIRHNQFVQLVTYLGKIIDDLRDFVSVDGIVRPLFYLPRFD